ncbi:unnamed protein product [Peronospora farinosa]|uniref:Uncharacterized protein n=1 Tax=Peronospora farinosa TaxID=134698 RepID=A0AAV0T3G1_9STRA|nr:unnamed protein product [Peronospora farinosa]
MCADAEALVQLAATGLAGIFAGASIYISVAQHPALMETDALIFQAPFFRRMYFYAARMQGPMAVGSGFSALLVSLLQKQRGPHAGMPKLWLTSGCLIGGIVPFTALKMLGLNYKLVDSKRCVNRGQSWMQEMLRRWGKLHAVRAGASALAFSGMLVAMACGGDRTPASAFKIWVVEELWYLRRLFVKNVRRLLHLLSTTARKARAEIAALLHKYYSLLFEDTPVRVYKAVVDFNRWLTEVLGDTHSKNIDWGPSYGGHSWLALEEQPRHSRTRQWTLAFDNASTVQLLQTACEYYMVRCDRLETTNASLETQQAELKARLKEALTRAFEAQQALQPKSSDEHPLSLNQQRTSALSTLDTISKTLQKNTEETSVGESNPASDLDSEVEDALADYEDIELEVATFDNQDELLPSLPSDDIHEEQEIFELSMGQLELDPVTSSVVMCDPIHISSDSDYEQLTKLRSDEANSGSWYRHALRILKEARKLRSKTRATVGQPSVTKLTASAVCKEAEAQEFTQLVFTGSDDEDSAWYRKALQHLKKERKHRLSLRDRAESFSSTISLVD